MIIKIDSSILEVFLPENTLEWFDIVQSKKDEAGISLLLEEKNIPPISPEHKDKKIFSKGFHDITITDFPIRGRRAQLTFRRRRWQAEGSIGLIKRDIKLTAEGVQLEKEFADFLKERS
ncbi:MAG: transposase [Candidatus Magasanikbacteria bacterium]|nr:transposase [Candidatus Magasanikbacteria bacterium]